MRNWQIKFLLSVLLIVFSLTLNAQTDKSLGSWNGLGIKWELNDKLSFFIESRLRGYDFYDKFYYYEYTFRASYAINDIFSVSAGGGKHELFPKEGNFIRPMENSEFRIYQEIVANTPYSRFFFDHRIRLEQRFIDSDYENRFRYRIACSIPLNHTTIIPKTFFISTWDELFINIPKIHLQLNRFFGGINYKLEHVTFQSGIVNQIFIEESTTTRKNFFLISMLFEVRQKRQIQAPYIN